MGHVKHRPSAMNTPRMRMSLLVTPCKINCGCCGGAGRHIREAKARQNRGQQRHADRTVCATLGLATLLLSDHHLFGNSMRAFSRALYNMCPKRPSANADNHTSSAPCTGSAKHSCINRLACDDGSQVQHQVPSHTQKKNQYLFILLQCIQHHWVACKLLRPPHQRHHQLDKPAHILELLLVPGGHRRLPGRQPPQELHALPHTDLCISQCGALCLTLFGGGWCLGGEGGWVGVLLLWVGKEGYVGLTLGVAAALHALEQAHLLLLSRCQLCQCGYCLVELCATLVCQWVSTWTAIVE